MKKMTPPKAWACVFAVWAVLLSGVAAQFVGSPGVIQAVRLKNLLASQQADLESEWKEVTRLQDEARYLEKSKVVQQREIRRVLGYAASDEIIFDFTGSDVAL
jgi:cell division protein FtsB